MFLVMLLWNYSVLVDASGIFSIWLALLHRGMRFASVAMDFLLVHHCKPVVSGVLFLVLRGCGDDRFVH